MLTPKCEKFVQNLISGMSQREAYRNAFPSSVKWKDATVDSKASDLFNTDEILERYNELQDEFKERALYTREQAVVTAEYARQFIKKSNRQVEYFEQFSAALDTAYSQKSPDTIAMSFTGITNLGRCFMLSEQVYNNAELNTPIAPSDTVIKFIAFLDKCRDEWGFARNVFIDSADQATITEFAKHKRLHGSAYSFNAAWKKMKIIDRINLQLGWFAHDEFLIVDTCANYIHELDTYSWNEEKDNTPEDRNDHMINSVQYAFIPYKDKIGSANADKI